MKLKVLLLILLLLPLLSGCGDHDADRAELERIDSLASNRQPRRALELLDSMDAHELSASNRNLHELLRIKARDKDFQLHRSNTAILRLVDYYRRHPSEGRYAEALYYAGRVYYDIGDFPSALKFYQQALDEYKAQGNAPEMEARVMYHISYLLNNLRLYDEATDLLKKSHWYKRQYGDSLNFIDCLELLGTINLHQKKFVKADSTFLVAYDLAKDIKSINSRRNRLAHIQMYRAGVQLEQGNYNKALALIRGLPEEIDSVHRHMVLNFASEIYMRAGIKDTASIYARQLLTYPKVASKKLAYDILLAPEMLELIPEDSLSQYISRYTDVMDKFVSRNSNDKALIQQSSYNYRLHEEGKKKADHKIKILYLCILSLCLLILILLFVVCYIWNNYKAISLKTSNSEGDPVKREISVTEKKNPEENVTAVQPSQYLKNEEEQKKLREALLNIVRNCNKKTTTTIPKVIMDSEPFNKLTCNLKTNTAWNSESTEWDELEKIVLVAWPEFKDRFQILSGNIGDKSSYHLALLIKCGFRPKKCASLLAVEPPGLSYRRERLFVLLFGVKIIKKLDYLVALI